MLWSISLATSSTDRSPWASRSMISARRPLPSALATDANASYNSSFASRGVWAAHQYSKYHLNTGSQDLCSNRHLNLSKGCMGANITSFVSEGLGHSSYLVDLGDGTALVIDPARIPTSQLEEAARHGLMIAYTADTHTHADYISGSPDLAAPERPVPRSGRRRPRRTTIGASRR